MNTAKLVNSALTGGGLIYPENLNVIIGNESKGYPKGYVLDANATLSLAGNNGAGGNSSNHTSSNLDKYLKINTVLEDSDNSGNKFYSRSLDMLSDKENDYLSIDLQNKEYPSDISLNYISGSANFNLGSVNALLGKNNLAIGTGLYSTNSSNSNILLGYKITIQVNKNPGGKLRLLVKKDSIIEYCLKEGLYGITDRFAIIKNGNKYSFKKISDTNTLTRVSYQFTRIDDNTIEMTNPNLDKLNECDYVVGVSVTSDGKYNISCGHAIFNGGTSSIIVGTALSTNALSSGKYPTNIQCFGIGNKVSNNCEFASGAYNITNNKTVGNYQYNTVFSIGAGSLLKGNLNALELIAKKNTTDNTSINALYVNGVGGYDGTNVSDDNTKSLQQVISDISSNSNPLSSYDSVLKCINSKPMISSNERIEDVIKGVLKKGWKNIALNVTFTKDNVWIVTNTTLFRIGSENKLSNEVTFAEIQSGNYNFIKLEDACKLIRYYGANFYAIVQNVKAKEEYLYDNKPYVHKLTKTLIACGLRKRYSIVSFDADILKKVIEVDDFANVGLFCISEISEESGLKSKISSSISDINMKRYDFNMVSGHGSVFLVCGFNTIKNLNMNAVSSLIENNCDLCISDLNQTTNIEEVKNMNQYITLAFCNDVHIGKKLLESNV